MIIKSTLKNYIFNAGPQNKKDILRGIFDF
jgi:hypothetical protein